MIEEGGRGFVVRELCGFKNVGRVVVSLNFWFKMSTKVDDDGISWELQCLKMFEDVCA